VVEDHREIFGVLRPVHLRYLKLFVAVHSAEPTGQFI